MKWFYQSNSSERSSCDQRSGCIEVASLCEPFPFCYRDEERVLRCRVGFFLFLGTSDLFAGLLNWEVLDLHSTSFFFSSREHNSSPSPLCSIAIDWIVFFCFFVFVFVFVLRQMTSFETRGTFCQQYGETHSIKPKSYKSAKDPVRRAGEKKRLGKEGGSEHSWSMFGS